MFTFAQWKEILERMIRALFISFVRNKKYREIVRHDVPTINEITCRDADCD